MESVRVLKLGTMCRDKATGLSGTVTHWMMNMGRTVDYLFQPKGLNDEGQPLKKLYLCAERLEVKGDDFETIDIPFDILGSKVMDKASGFTGMAVQFVRHPSGCFHVEIQPKGILPKKGTPIVGHDFDLRECVGDKIPKLTAQETKESTARTPSPSERPERKSYD